MLLRIESPGRYVFPHFSTWQLQHRFFFVEFLSIGEITRCDVSGEAGYLQYGHPHMIGNCKAHFQGNLPDKHHQNPVAKLDIDRDSSWHYTKRTRSAKSLLAKATCCTSLGVVQPPTVAIQSSPQNISPDHRPDADLKRFKIRGSRSARAMFVLSTRCITASTAPNVRALSNQTIAAILPE